MTCINVYTLKMVKESGAKYNVEKAVTSPAMAANIAREVLELHEQPNEVFAIICLNTKNYISGVHVISQGSLNASIVHPREVYKAAALNNASGIILLHNHPSGDPTPSNEDLETTKRLINAGEIMGIKVLDHVIIGDSRYCSLKEMGAI